MSLDVLRLLRGVGLDQLPAQQEDVEVRGHDDHQGAQGVHREPPPDPTTRFEKGVSKWGKFACVTVPLHD